jgi:hypothetical protein
MYVPHVNEIRAWASGYLTLSQAITPAQLIAQPQRNLGLTPAATPTATASPTATPTATQTPSIVPTATPTTGSIQVFAWHDLNRNGTQQQGEPPLAGVLVEVSARAMAPMAWRLWTLESGATPIASCTTGPTGVCAFGGLLPGTYVVSLTPPAGYRFPTASDAVDVWAGQTTLVRFGAQLFQVYLPLIGRKRL